MMLNCTGIGRMITFHPKNKQDYNVAFVTQSQSVTDNPSMTNQETIIILSPRVEGTMVVFD